MKSYISPTDDPSLSRVVTEFYQSDLAIESDFGAILMRKAVDQISALLVEEFIRLHRDKIIAQIDLGVIQHRVTDQLVQQIVKEAAKIIGK
jgi:hypothetical protein